MRQIELLSPARNADCGIEAILHGADAVYIGGPSFSARAAAGNSVEDIARLCRFAHLYGARIYITLNTILHDDELSEAERMVHELYQAGVDALIVQDLGLLRLDLPPIALHASTQMDNRTPEQARRLEALGFSQIVVARELSLTDIRAISQATPLPLEAFVHGALCVSYSGQCYASQYCFGRSANRGCCAQFCRLAFDLVDSEGRTVIRDKHLLSLRDMNRLNSLEAMMDAGVSSFKIEGRLKEAGYVKNVTAAYRQAIDKILERRAADYCRSSYGRSTLTFTPQPEKSFNRGFTEYFLHDRRTPMHSFDTPKAMGEAIGEVNRVERRAFTIHPAKPSPSSDGEICAGDGLCYIDPDGHLQGFRVNRVDPDGRILPATMPPFAKGQNFFGTMTKPLTGNSPAPRPSAACASPYIFPKPKPGICSGSATRAVAPFLKVSRPRIPKPAPHSAKPFSRPSPDWAIHPSNSQTPTSNSAASASSPHHN